MRSSSFNKHLDRCLECLIFVLLSRGERISDGRTEGDLRYVFARAGVNKVLLTVWLE